MNAGLTGPEPAASQRELDQLRAEIHRLDDGGSRGVGAVQVQLTEAIKDIAELRGDMRAHEGVHQRETVARISGRRWAIGTALSGGVLLVAILALLVDIAGHLH